MKRASALPVLIAVVLAPRAAHAESDEVRYERILAALDRAGASSERWWNGWAIGFAACGAGQGVLAIAARDDGLRVDSAVGAVSCGLGVVGMLLEPRTAIGAGGELRAMSSSAARARQLRLRRAEALLGQVAREQSDGRSWVPHVLGSAVNLAGSAVLWLGYQRYGSGWLNLLGGTVVTELQIATRPAAAISEARALHAATPAWWVVPTARGLSFGAAF